MQAPQRHRLMQRPAFLLLVQTLGAVSAVVFGILLALGMPLLGCLPFALLGVVPLAVVPTAALIERLGLQRSNDSLTEALEARTSELERTRDAMIMGLARFAEFRDGLTGQHLERVAAFSRQLALTMRALEPERYTQLTDSWIRDLQIGSALHDIGKVGIPDEVLLKEGALTPEERALIEDHPIIGGECISSMQALLEDSQLLSIARDIAFSHHERWDGTGYPYKQQGEDIALVARIVSVADVYDALTNARTYKRAMPHEQAIDIIRKESGTQFDPHVIEALMNCHESIHDIAIQMSRNDLEAYDDLEAIVESDSDEALQTSAL